MTERAQALEAALRNAVDVMKLFQTCYPAAIASLPDNGMERFNVAIETAREALLAVPPPPPVGSPTTEDDELRNAAERLLLWAEARVAEDAPWPPEVTDMRAALSTTVEPAGASNGKS